MLPAGLNKKTEGTMNDQDKWSINESSLQSYRSIFISSESFMIAVGAILLDKNFTVLVAIAVVSVLMIWGIWVPVVRSRHLIVDYYKYRSMKAEPVVGLCEERDYVHDRQLRNKANQLLGIKANWRPTRWKIDLLTPILLTVMWILIVVSAKPQ